MARIRLVDDCSAEELRSIDNIVDTAYYHLMLNDLDRAGGLVELLVERLRAQIDEIRVSERELVGAR